VCQTSPYDRRDDAADEKHPLQLVRIDFGRSEHFCTIGRHHDCRDRADGQCEWAGHWNAAAKGDGAQTDDADYRHAQYGGDQHGGDRSANAKRPVKSDGDAEGRKRDQRNANAKQPAPTCKWPGGLVSGCSLDKRPRALRDDQHDRRGGDHEERWQQKGQQTANNAEQLALQVRGRANRCREYQIECALLSLAGDSGSGDGGCCECHHRDFDNEHGGEHESRGRK
jgi:hypothetical protein